MPAGVLKKAGSEIVIIILCHSARLSFDLKHTLRYVLLCSLVWSCVYQCVHAQVYDVWLAGFLLEEVGYVR